MKYALLLFFGTLFFACAPYSRLQEKDVTTTYVWRSFSRDLHVDTDFTPDERAFINEAVGKWTNLSVGHIRLLPVYDLDFGSSESVIAQYRAGNSTVVKIDSTFPAVAVLDEYTKPYKAVAFTVHKDANTDRVLIISDRIKSGAMFLSTVTHEFGHVVGLPDLPSFGSIMSGASLRDEDPIVAFTVDDIELCRGYRYCP